MEFIRIGDKLININKIDDTVRRILKLRSEGLSQQDVAARLQLDRAFISRLETMGNVRRGARIGLIAFPVANKEELAALVKRFGIEKSLVLSDKERWQLMERQSGIEFFNQVIEVIEQFRQCDLVFVFCSTKWNRLAEALLDIEVITFEIGKTPITGDIYVDPGQVERLLEPFVGNDCGEGKR